MLLLDPITAQQFIDRGGFVNKADLIRWIHENGTRCRPRVLGSAARAELHLSVGDVRARTGGDDAQGRRTTNRLRIFQEKNINVVVVGGETNGYWRIMGATYRKSVSVDDWR